MLHDLFSATSICGFNILMFCFQVQVLFLTDFSPLIYVVTVSVIGPRGVESALEQTGIEMNDNYYY
jgi:hypothetical protein